MRKLLVLLFVVAFFSVNAQEKSSFQKNKLSENTVVQPGTEKSIGLKSKTELRSINSDKVVVISDYANMEKKIIESLKGTSIPASVPKFVRGQSIEEYKMSLRSWAKKNTSLLSDDFLQKLNNIKDIK
jgi:hypothetical protein